MIRAGKRFLRRGSGFCADEAGNGMVEFAIAGSLFAALLMGIFEFGLAAWSRNNVAADAREGARYAIVHGSRSSAIADQAAVATYVKSRSMLGNSIRVYATWPDGSKAQGKLVVVSVAVSVPRRGPFIPAHTDSATSKMHILY
jgi:Flp pilus assembly protein TadG